MTFDTFCAALEKRTKGVRAKKRTILYHHNMGNFFSLIRAIKCRILRSGERLLQPSSVGQSSKSSGGEGNIWKRHAVNSLCVCVCARESAHAGALTSAFGSMKKNLHANNWLDTHAQSLGDRCSAADKKWRPNNRVAIVPLPWLPASCGFWLLCMHRNRFTCTKSE